MITLTKPVVGRLYVTLSATHPDPRRVIEDSAHASFWNLPGARWGITAVTPEPYDPVRKFGPHVVYEVTAR